MQTISRRNFVLSVGSASAGLALHGSPAILARTTTERSLDWLSQTLAGPVLFPGDAMFSELSLPRNLRFASTVPRAVALCRDADDVAKALLWAQETETPFAIRGGGHNYMLASTSPGLIISTRLMNRAKFSGSSLEVEAGILNRDLGRVLVNGGRGELILPGGNCPNVGLTGVTLGGGIGPNAPWAGLAADRLKAVTMVTSSGNTVTASANTNPDLFWALRGSAGGNLGIVTNLEYSLLPIPISRATTFRVAWSGVAAALRVVTGWQKLKAAEPRLISGTCSVSRVESDIRTSIRGQVLADGGVARELLAPLIQDQSVAIEVTELPWWDVYAWYVTRPSPNYSFWDRSLFADQDLPEAAIVEIIEICRKFPRSGIDRRGSFTLFGWVGGAVSDTSPQATAYVHRNARALIEVSVGWPSTRMLTGQIEPIPSDIRAWSDELWSAFFPYTTGRSYQNFPDPDLKNSQQAYYGENLERLRSIKRRWDPGNVFRYPQSIES